MPTRRKRKSAELDVVVPVRNEAGNIAALVRRVDRSLSVAKISYRIIFVVDPPPAGIAADGTEEEIKKLTSRYPISVYHKEGKPGKSYSLVEGTRLAKAQYVVMIDGDLQYPPEAIPEMYAKRRDFGVVVANRRKYKGSTLRVWGSKLDSFFTGKLLLGLNCDIQSGLKLFRREIIDHVDLSKVGPWTFDIPLLYTVKELGFTIGSVDINFIDRRKGASKVSFIKTAVSILETAFKVRFSPKRILQFSGPSPKSATGAGVAYKQRRFITHSTLHHERSAIKTFTDWQRVFIFGVAGLLVAGLILKAHATALSLIAVVSVVYFCDLLLSLYLIYKSLREPPEIHLSGHCLSGLGSHDLPVYSILCPLYREAKVLPQFLEAIDRLDWPKDKLDVLLLLEEDDKQTIEVARQLNPPAYVRTVIVPHSLPKTKPKACNYGLAMAKGKYVVIYDAEDKPEPLQLKKAYLGFTKVPKNVFCLQAKLNYYNPKQNLLTRIFTAEYSLWFEAILPGLQSIETAIPLGGTSNHFRTVDLRKLEGWDPFNVTEDCDLGVRLFKEGYRTAILDSVTLEEANSRLGNWLRQRSRWIKGYIQTYWVHMRHPWQFVRKHGIHAFVFQLVIGGKIASMFINPLLWAMTFSYFAFRRYVGVQIESLYPPVIFYLAVFSLVVGNFVYLYSYMLGCAKREQWWLIKYVYLVPFYWFMISWGAVIALYQLIFKPHYWEKTAHGFHLGGETVQVHVQETEKEKERVGRIVPAPAWVAAENTRGQRGWSRAAFGLLIIFTFVTGVVGGGILVTAWLAQSQSTVDLSFISGVKLPSFRLPISQLAIPGFSPPGSVGLSVAFLAVGSLGMIGSALLVIYHLVRRKDNFSVLWFVFSIFYILGVLIFNDSVLETELVIYVGGIVSFFSLLFLHFHENLTNVVLGNIKDLAGIFAPSRWDVGPKVEGKLRILVFNWRDTRHVWGGGAEVYLQELAKRWVKMGHAVTLFCGNDKKCPRYETIDGVRIIRRGGFYTVYLFAFLYYLRHFRGKYDVILDSENGIPFFTPLYAKEKIFLLIYHVHQEVFRQYLTPPLSWIASFLEGGLMPFIYRNVQFITVSPSSKADIITRGFTKVEPAIVYSGVDTKAYIPGVKSKTPLVLYLGRLRHYKSLHIFLSSAKHILAKIPEVKFVIAGDGEEKENLQRITESLGITKSVKFLGRVSDEERMNLYRKAWIFVNPSLMEGWGITSIEANACGTPVVASNVPGLRDSVHNPHSGLLLPYGDVNAFAKATEKLIENKRLRQKMSKESVEWAKSYSWQESAMHSVRLFKTIWRKEFR